MKKFLIAFCSALFFSSAANATGLFVGVDALYASTRHEAKNSSTTSGPRNGSVHDSDDFGYGVNAGFRFDLLNLLASAELFYDDFRASSSNFESQSGLNTSGEIEIKNRYGAKANLGFAILPRITPFITYGLTNVDYQNKNSLASIDKSKMTPLYGVGLMIDLPFDISVKASYDYQQFTMRNAESGNIRTHLGVAKLGLIYNF